MAELKQVRERARGAARKVRAGVRGGDVGELRRRVGELEAEVQECRQLNLRLAELTDVVQELLVPLARRDERDVAAVLEKYSQGL